MKIAIVVGHNARARGAVSVDGTAEYDWNGELAALIQDHNEAAVRVFRRTFGGGYSAEIDRVYAEVNAWAADCSIELHFNGSASASAKGTKTLSSGTPGSMLLAREIHTRCHEVIERKDRGIEVRTRRQRGGRSLWVGRAPAIMTEPFFGSNAEDWRRANARMDQLAEAVYRGAVAFCREAVPA